MHKRRMSELTLFIGSLLEAQKEALQASHPLVLLICLHSCGRIAIPLHKPEKLQSKSQKD